MYFTPNLKSIRDFKHTEDQKLCTKSSKWHLNCHPLLWLGYEGFTKTPFVEGIIPSKWIWSLKGYWLSQDLVQWWIDNLIPLMSSGRKWVEPGWGKLVTRAMPLNSTSSPGYHFLLLPSLSIVSLPPPLASFHVALTPSLLPPYAPATMRFASPPAQNHRVNWYRVDTSENVSQNTHFLVYTRCLDTWTKQ